MVQHDVQHRDARSRRPAGRSAARRSGCVALILAKPHPDRPAVGLVAVFRHVERAADLIALRRKSVDRGGDGGFPITMSPALRGCAWAGKPPPGSGAPGPKWRARRAISWCDLPERGCGRFAEDYLHVKHIFGEPQEGHGHGEDDGGGDLVDRLQEDWARERPELDDSAMAVVGRLLHLGRALEARANAALKSVGLAYTDFDVLATLRRAGEPFPPGAHRAAPLGGADVRRDDRLLQPPGGGAGPADA